MSEEIPEGFEPTVIINIKQLLSIIIVATVIMLYFFYEPVGIWIDFILDQILSDWQLLTSFIIIIAITVGWYLIEFIAYLLFSAQIKVHRSLTSRTTNYIRLFISSYFLSVLITYYFFNLSFENWTLWIIASIICFAILLFLGSMVKVKKAIQKKKGISPKKRAEIKETSVLPEYPSEYIEFSFYKAISVILGIIFALIIFFTNAFGFQDWVFYIFDIIDSHLLLKSIFWILVCLTLFWKPILWIVLLLCYLANLIIQKSVKKKINMIRFLLMFLVIVLLISNNLHRFGLSEWEVEIYSILLSFISGAISGYVMRRLFFK